jgi:XTP/dITP diphosphohydrolase
VSSAAGDPLDRTLLVATRNAGKRAELHVALAPLGYHLVDLNDVGVDPSPLEDAVEAFSSFEENAVAKARYYSAASGGLATIADDSGLSVDALGGAPGVFSRRWAGAAGSDAQVARANNAKLLGELADGRARDARFVCAVALADGPDVVVARGEVLGRIAHTPRGARGFGYDPLFECGALGWRTFAEVSAEEKAAVSHRGRALTTLAAALSARTAARPTPAAG